MVPRGESMSAESNRVFPPFRLDLTNQELWRGSQRVILRPKTFDVLRYLVEHPGQLVTKSALLDTLWPDVTVGDTLPANSVTEIRKALGDNAHAPRFIETVQRRGYRFIAPVRHVSEQRALETVSEPAPPSLMVGREAEITQLDRWFEQVREKNRMTLFVTGEAGIGKTAFVQNFLDSLSPDRKTRIGRGQCIEQYGAGEPYMPVLEALSRIAGEPGGESVREMLSRFAPTWLAQMPELLNYPERSYAPDETRGVTQQQRMLREMARTLDALAAEEPLVLVLEDLHWSDFSTLELISAIARRRDPACLLIIGTYRPVEIFARDHPLRGIKQELELHNQCQELRLKLLSKENVAEYLSKRLTSSGARTYYLPHPHATE